jgi:nicotinate-nucleotide adenylyltransferase
LAEEAVYAHALNRVVFVPCFIPPHKSSKEVAPPQDRLNMTLQACQGNKLFEVSDMEINLQGPSFTVRTLEIFSQKEGIETFFILGTDSLREIHMWRECERIFSLSHFIVVTRPGTDFQSAWADVPRELREQFRDKGDHLVHSSSTRLLISPVKGLNISATQVRNLIRAGVSVRYLVPEPVRLHILEHGLYS